MAYYCFANIRSSYFFEFVDHQSVPTSHSQINVCPNIGSTWEHLQSAGEASPFPWKWQFMGIPHSQTDLNPVVLPTPADAKDL